MRVGPRAAITKRVELDLGTPATGNGLTVFPLGWRPAGAGALVPVMEADVVVAPLDEDVTQISFEGRSGPRWKASGGCSTEPCSTGWPSRRSATSSTGWRPGSQPGNNTTG